MEEKHENQELDWLGEPEQEKELPVQEDYDYLGNPIKKEKDSSNPSKKEAVIDKKEEKEPSWF